MPAIEGGSVASGAIVLAALVPKLEEGGIDRGGITSALGEEDGGDRGEVGARGIEGESGVSNSGMGGSEGAIGTCGTGASKIRTDAIETGAIGCLPIEITSLNQRLTAAHIAQTQDDRP